MKRKSRGLHRRNRIFHFKIKMPDGKWHERTTHTENYQQALAVKATMAREMEQGLLPSDRHRWTLGPAAAEWLDYRRLRVAHGTFLSERSIIRNLLRLLGEQTVLQKIADIHAVNQYESQRLAEGVSAKTVNNEVLVISGILRKANLWHRVEALYKPLRVRKSDVGDALTNDEVRKLLRVARDWEGLAVAPLAAVGSCFTGMRLREIQQLQHRSLHLDAARPFLYVRRSTTKSDKGARYVALGQIACWALRKLVFRAQILGATEPEHFLCPTRREKHTRKSDPLHGGQGYDPTHPQTSWAKEWNDLRRRVGIEHRRFHDLRHTYISRAAEAGVPLAVTQAQVGHMTVQMVEHYTHVCHGAIHHAVAQIEEYSADLLTDLNPSSVTEHPP